MTIGGELLLIFPALLLLLGAGFALIAGLVAPAASGADIPVGHGQAVMPAPQPRPAWGVPLVSGAALLAALGCLGVIARRPEVLDGRPLLGGALQADGFGLAATAIILAATFGVVLLAAGSARELRELRLREGELHALILSASAGAILLAMSRHLLTLLLALELVSLSGYVLAGARRAAPRSVEAALKYLVLGGCGTAALVFGSALFYGATGSFSLAANDWLPATGLPREVLLAAAAAFLLAGFAVKAGVVPFHQWVPDVYEGAPTAVTAYFAAVVKLAAFALLVRLLADALGLPDAGVAGWTGVLAALALVTMLVGNVAALAQRSVKRMLAYSAIAHTGYLLLAFLHSPGEARAPLLFYLVAYAAATLGAFAVVAVPKLGGGEHETLEDCRGLGRRAPALALAMLFFLASLGGLPPLAGFWAKLFVFKEAVAGGWTWLAVVGVLASAVSLYYYLRVAVYMYLDDEYMHGAEEPEPEEQPDASPATVLVIYTCAALVVLLGLLPGGVIDWLAGVVG